jgi:TPM domain
VAQPPHEAFNEAASLLWAELSKDLIAMRLQSRWWLALGAAGALLVGSTGALASEIRDPAGMFDADAVSKAKEALDRVEREYDVPVLLETIEALPGNPTTSEEKNRQVNGLAVQRDRDEGNRGIYVLFAKDSRVMSNVLVPGWLSRHLTQPRRIAIRNAFLSEFKKNDYNTGLISGVKTIDETLATAKAEAGGPLRTTRPGAGAGRVVRVPGAAPGAAARARGGSGWSAMLAILAVIFGIVLVIRILGSLFGGRQQVYGPGQMPGPAGMMGPGYGGGYGRGGGGFWSGMLGGLGGAMAGNWLYDRMSGRHYGGGTPFDSGNTGAAGPFGNGGGPADNEIVGGNDPGGGNWGDSGGGGGDWGGGGDCGGGGGDWGGGGGDGGGGGGDW